ncbi:MAG: TonB-dependent receptor [Candidatus Aminicenantes bacterium]|nr:TonB-dependent receptor [Candidatus Aminicenantes bacterium]
MRFVCCVWAYLLAAAPAPGQDEESLQELQKLLKTRISTAAKYEQLAGDAPASVAIVGSEEIRRYGFRTLDEVLRIVPGFAASYDRNYAYLGVRGFGRPTDYNDRVLLLLNGNALNEGMYGSAAIGTDLGLDLGAVERIEIVRGPASALYGTGAMFCVINIVSKKGSDLNGFRMSAEVGSFGRTGMSAAFGKKLADGTDILLAAQFSDVKGRDLYFKEFDDPETDGGWARGLDWDVNFGLNARLVRGGLTFQAMAASRGKGIPTAPWDTVFDDPRAKTLDVRSVLELRYDLDLGAAWMVGLRSYYNHCLYEGYYSYGYLNRDETTAEKLGGEIQLRWDPSSEHRLFAGVEYQNHLRADYRNWDPQTVNFDGNFPYRIWSLYLQDQIKIRSNLSLTLGLRRDEYSTAGSSTTPRLALVYHPWADGTFKLLYGEAFRAPNPYEVHYELPSEGYKSNPGLRPEKIRSFEAIWEQKLGRPLLGFVNVYRYILSGLIDQAPDPADGLLQFRNLGKVRAAGVELGLTSRWASGVWAQASYAFQSAEDAATGAKLTNALTHVFKAGLSCPVFKLGFVSIQLLAESERLTVARTATKPFRLADLAFVSGDRLEPFRISVRIRNIFNETYALPGGFEHRMPAIVQDPRNYSVKLEYLF